MQEQAQRQREAAQPGAPYQKRFVFPTADEVQEFLHSFYDVEVSRLFQVTSQPIVVEVPGGKGLNFETLLLPVETNGAVAALSAELLDGSLLDGYLRPWKGYLAPIPSALAPA